MNADFKKNFVDSMEDVNMKNAMSSFKQRSLTNSKSIALHPRNPNEMVLAIGGWNGGDLRNDIEIGANYGPWKKIKARHNMPVKRELNGIGLVNNVMFLFGGFSLRGYPRSTFAFDTINKVTN